MAPSRLLTALREAADLFFPPLCLLCDAVLPGRVAPEVCADCRQRFPAVRPPFCARCGAPGPGAAACRHCGGWAALDAARSAFLYAGPVRAWIRQLKYGGLPQLATLAGEPLAAALRGLPARELPTGVVVAPVPLHAARRRERGFNQAELLAAALGRTAGLPVMDLLHRSRATRGQVGLPARERSRNVHGAFRVPVAERAVVRGRAVIVVDDVLTTGSTLEAAAGALRAAGAAGVAALTLARALPGHDA